MTRYAIYIIASGAFNYQIAQVRRLVWKYIVRICTRADSIDLYQTMHLQVCMLISTIHLPYVVKGMFLLNMI